MSLTTGFVGSHDDDKVDIFEDDSEEMMLRLVEMVDLEERTDLEKTVDPTEEDQNCTHNSGEADLSDDNLDKKF